MTYLLTHLCSRERVLGAKNSSAVLKTHALVQLQLKVGRFIADQYHELISDARANLEHLDRPEHFSI